MAEHMTKMTQATDFHFDVTTINQQKKKDCEAEKEANVGP